MKPAKRIIYFFVGVFILSACLSNPVKQGLQNELGTQKAWQTYTSTKYHFTIQFPTDWEVKELPTEEYPMVMNQIWFVSEMPPPPQTDARANITLVFSVEDPSLKWSPLYFDEYQSDIYQMGNVQGRKISGINKESKSPELVVMAEIGDYYVQALPNNSDESLKYFDLVISSMHFDNVATSTPTPTGISTPTAVVKETAVSDEVPLCFVTGFVPIGFMPDGDRILVRTEKGIQIFNLQNMEEEEFIPAPTGKNLSAVAMSPDGKFLAWALDDLSIQLIRISDKKLLHTLTGHTELIGKLSFSPDGERLFSASHDTWVRIWDLEGNLVHTFQPTGALDIPNEVLGIDVSPDGMMLATIPFDGPVKLWDLKKYKLVRELGGSGGFDTSDITFSPDGQLVASDTATGLFLWKTTNGTELLGGNPGINSMAVAFSPDGSLLAYGEIGDKYDVVLSLPDGSRKIRTLEGHPSPVGSVIFSPDSSLLLSSDWVEIRVWRVVDGELIAVGKSACP